MYMYDGCDCGDNRFEIIAEYKEKLIDGTNIESSPEEMAVIDNILFRLWQMGWIPVLRMPTPDEIEQAKNEFIPVPDGGRSELQAWAVSGFERGVSWLMDWFEQQKFARPTSAMSIKELKQYRFKLLAEAGKIKQRIFILSGEIIGE